MAGQGHQRPAAEAVIGQVGKGLYIRRRFPERGNIDAGEPLLRKAAVPKCGAELLPGQRQAVEPDHPCGGAGHILDIRAAQAVQRGGRRARLAPYAVLVAKNHMVAAAYCGEVTRGAHGCRCCFRVGKFHLRERLPRTALKCEHIPCCCQCGLAVARHGRADRNAVAAAHRVTQRSIFQPHLPLIAALRACNKDLDTGNRLVDHLPKGDAVGPHAVDVGIDRTGKRDRYPGPVPCRAIPHDRFGKIGRAQLCGHGALRPALALAHQQDGFDVHPALELGLPVRPQQQVSGKHDAFPGRALCCDVQFKAAVHPVPFALRVESCGQGIGPGQLCSYGGVFPFLSWLRRGNCDIACFRCACGCAAAECPCCHCQQQPTPQRPFQFSRSCHCGFSSWL